MSDAPSITGTLTHPTITNQTSPHFAEALGAAALQSRSATHTTTRRSPSTRTPDTAVPECPFTTRAEKADPLVCAFLATTLTSSVPALGVASTFGSSL
jgi:hypothetical protein